MDKLKEYGFTKTFVNSVEMTRHANTASFIAGTLRVLLHKKGGNLRRVGMGNVASNILKILQPLMYFTAALHALAAWTTVFIWLTPVALVQLETVCGTSYKHILIALDGSKIFLIGLALLLGKFISSPANYFSHCFAITPTLS